MAYLLVTGALAVVMFIVGSSLMRQVSSLAQTVQFLLRPAGEHQTQPVIDFLSKLGITRGQVAVFKNQLLSQALGALCTGVVLALLRVPYAALLGALFAGALQQITVALWQRWKSRHPEQFPPQEPLWRYSIYG